MPIDLPSITGKVHHDVEQAILRLREALESTQAMARAAQSTAASQPALTLPQIQEALSPTGSHPLATASALNSNEAPATPPQTPQLPPGTTFQDDYVDVCNDGTHVTAAAPQANATPSVVFNGDAPITIPYPGKFLWAESGSFGHLAIVQGLDGIGYLIDRATMVVTPLGTVYGNYAVAIRNDGTPVWQDSASTYMVGGVSTPIPAPFVGTQNGFLSLDAGGDPVWTDAQITSPVVINDVTFALASTDGNWTVGRSDITGQFIAYNASTNLMYLACLTGNSPVAARITQLSDGSAVVSRSLPSGFFASGAFQPYSVAPPVPPSEIDLAEVIWAKGVNAKDWTPTSTLGAVTHIDTTLCTPHSKAGQWPVVPFFDEDATVEGNQWLFAFLHTDEFPAGRWYAGAAEWLRPGQTCKDYAGDIGGDDFGGTPMGTWNPVEGEFVGIMVSCPARAGQWSLAERSNVVIIAW